MQDCVIVSLIVLLNKRHLKWWQQGQMTASHQNGQNVNWENWIPWNLIGSGFAMNAKKHLVYSKSYTYK